MASVCRLIVPGVFVPPSSYKVVVLAVRLLYTVLYTKERPTGVFAMFLFRKFIKFKKKSLFVECACYPLFAISKNIVNEAAIL